MSLGSLSTYAATDVIVGGYTFPPFVEETAPKGGLTKAIIEHLNTQQDKYDFQFKETTPRRRYRNFEQNDFDIMLFEMPAWGWEANDVDVTMIGPIMTGGEVYVGRADSVDGPDYFASVKDKRIAAFLGYHYGFADFESDPEVLRKRFDITLTQNHRANLRMIGKGRADIAVVTKSALQRFFKENPEAKEQFAVSERLDQEYRLHAVVDGDASAIAPADVKSLLRELSRSKAFADTLATFNISDQWVYGD